MNTEIMSTILTKLNRRMVREKRNILMDNVSSHSPTFCESFSNVKVVFLPVNTTSRLQPLDAGIIKNFKVHYRKQLLIDKHVLTKVNAEGANENASTICKSVDVLLAIRWIKQAWENVTISTIKNCFRRCGAIPQDIDQETATSDPFADLDREEKDSTLSSLEDLVSQIDNDITAEQYVNNGGRSPNVSYL